MSDIRGSGRSLPPSISVYPLQASGDTPPLRVIEGPQTQLNWPATIYLDAEREELYVANDADDSVLIFRATDSGNVAPIRVIKGPKTGIKNPTGIFVDPKNDEVWVSNMGNHSATVYPRTANGDAAPLRIIRSAPVGKQALAIGNPGAVGMTASGRRFWCRIEWPTRRLRPSPGWRRRIQCPRDSLPGKGLCCPHDARHPL